MTIKEIEEKKGKRASLVKDMRALCDKADSEKRDLNSDEKAKYAQMEADFDSIGNTIDREEKLAKTEASLAAMRDGNYRAEINGGSSKKSARTKANGAEYKDALNEYMRKGINGIGTPQYLNSLKEGQDAEGGYLVPEEFEKSIITKLADFDPIRGAATVITTGSDRNIPMEADAGTFDWIDEEGDYTEDDPAFGRVVLGANKAGGIIKVTEELLQDSIFDLDTYMSDLAGRRYGILEQAGFCTGNGTGKPLGLFATTSVGGVNITGTTGSASAQPKITDDNIIDTFHGLDPAYRRTASWLMNDAAVKLIRKLKDSTGQFLWQPGLQAGQPDMILGRPVLVSAGAPVPAANAKSIIFGDLKYYYIADRLGIAVQRLNELYAGKGLVGFRFRMRTDGKLVSPYAVTFFKNGPTS